MSFGLIFWLVGYHYQHSNDHGAAGLEVLASVRHEHLQYSKSAAVICQSTLAHSTTKPLTSPPPRTSAGSHYPQVFGRSQCPPSEVVNSWPSTQEHFHAPLISDHVKESMQCVHVISTPSSPTQEPAPTSPPALTPPDDGPMCELRTNYQQLITAISTSPSPIQEYIPASPSVPPDKPLSDHINDSSTDDQQCITVILLVHLLSLLRDMSQHLNLLLRALWHPQISCTRHCLAGSKT